MRPEEAQRILHEALARADLAAVPEEVEAFRLFCEGPFRRAMGHVGAAASEQIFERLGHVLWMATSDVRALETARSWSPHTGLHRDDDSGVQHIEPEGGLRAHAGRGPAPASDRERAASPHARGSEPTSSMSGSPVEPRAGAPGQSRRAPLVSSSRTGSAVLGRLSTIPPRPRVALESHASGVDPRTPPASPALGSPPPWEGAGPIPTSRRDAPTSVLVVTLDSRFVDDVRHELRDHCEVRCITEASELAAAVVAGGPRLVVLIDTALPSIGVPAFAGLAPILPPGARVILWGASLRQQQRLASMFPVASSWISSNGAPRAGAFILEP